MRKKLTPDGEFQRELALVATNKCFLCKKGDFELKVTLDPIIREFELPTTENSYWVFQHWQAAPKPKMGHRDEREFGYFICQAGVVSYETIPWEQIEIANSVKIVPIQSRRKYIPGVVPTAGNYFPDSAFRKTTDDKKWILEPMHKPVIPDITFEKTYSSRHDTRRLE